MDTVDFGNTNLKVPRLSFGTGTAGWGGRSEQTDLGVEGLANLLRLAGYEVEAVYGDFNKGELEDDSQEMVWVAKKVGKI